MIQVQQELSETELDAGAGGKGISPGGYCALSICTLGIGCAIYSLADDTNYACSMKG